MSEVNRWGVVKVSGRVGRVGGWVGGEVRKGKAVVDCR